ncbi:MAG: response regulator [bacterium]|nr:response regulator [bacterium]
MNGTILVIDDDESILSIFELILESMNYNIITSLSAKAALNIIKSKPSIDLVFLDLKIPKFSGIEFLHEIRENDAKLPIIMMTGYTSDASIRDALANGANDLIYKPFDVEDIRSTVMLYTQNKTTVPA